MGSIEFGSNSGFQVGVNNGMINFTSKQPEPRPEPLFTVPFPHDPDFVSRDGMLNTIHEKSSIPGSRIALVGLGGVGKTRLAIEYCHRVRQQSADTWVFWVHASTAARCEESLRNLADRAKIPGREDSNVNIFQLFGNWLQDGNIGKWVLILDNIDDDELLCKPLVARTSAQANAQPPLKYLTGTSTGFIIITSRNKAVALGIASHQKHLIDVQPMNMAEALDLMQHKLGSCAERAESIQLVEELEFMPLAIVQAASYIAHHSPRCSVSQYLKKLRQSDHQAIVLLNHEGQTDRDWEAKNSILLTWQISFDHIRRVRPSAADLLSLMSFFDWQGIPKDLLRVQDQARNHQASSPLGVESLPKSDLDDDFESDIITLRDYSFVTTTSENSMVFTMHRLVQLTARAWLEMNDQAEEWKERFINNLHAEFPTGQYEHWERCRTLFPHVKSAISHRPKLYGPKSQDLLQRWAELLYKGAWYAQESGNIPDSREMASISREQRIGIFGLDDEETLYSTALLAVAYRLEGAWREAEQLEVQVMETRKTKLGANHPDTLTSIANLALTFWHQGRWKEAEQLGAQVMETRKITLGADHPSTVTSIANLASTLSEQGRWEEAEKLEAQVMETRKATLGADHPYTLTSMANLASTLWNQGRWDEAEQLEVQVMETRKATLGADHPSTVTSIANLASTFSDQGRWEEAEQLETQVMETRKATLGADHPYTLTSMANLASTFCNLGRWKEAEQLGLQVLETRKTKLGADHPDTLASMNNLAYTLWSIQQEKAALLLMTDCVRLCERKIGLDHPQTMCSRSLLNEWREKAYPTPSSSSSQLTKAPSGSKEDQILSSSPETSKRVSRPEGGGHRRRTILSRFFGRK
ncbi:hypothetical protein N7507_009404 [Penicillium longicatenatum]|nr:hypothetical protein N7507_009404 [Penicillium longicatenatum]